MSGERPDGFYWVDGGGAMVMITGGTPWPVVCSSRVLDPTEIEWGERIPDNDTLRVRRNQDAVTEGEFSAAQIDAEADRHAPGCGTERRGCMPECDNYDPKYDDPEGDGGHVITVDREPDAVSAGDPKQPWKLPAEDRSRPPPGYTVTVANGRACALADGIHLEWLKPEVAVRICWEHHDAIAKPAYERGRTDGAMSRDCQVARILKRALAAEARAEEYDRGFREGQKQMAADVRPANDALGRLIEIFVSFGMPADADPGLWLQSHAKQLYDRGRREALTEPCEHGEDGAKNDPTICTACMATRESLAEQLYDARDPGGSLASAYDRGYSDARDELVPKAKDLVQQTWECAKEFGASVAKLGPNAMVMDAGEVTQTIAGLKSDLYDARAGNAQLHDELRQAKGEVERLNRLVRDICKDRDAHRDEARANGAKLKKLQEVITA